MVFEAFLFLKSLRLWGADVLHCSPRPDLASISKKDPWSFLSFQSNIHLRRPGGGQLGREKRRRKFSRTGERALGMLRLTNKFHDSFEYSLTGQHSLSCCSSDLLIRRSLTVNSTVCRTCLPRTRELSSRRVFII